MTANAKFEAGDKVSFRRGKLPMKVVTVSEVHIMYEVRDETGTRHVLREKELKKHG